MDEGAVEAAGYGYGYSDDPLFGDNEDTVLAGLRQECCDGLAFSNGQELIAVTSAPDGEFDVGADSVAVWFTNDSGGGAGFEVCFHM